MNQKEKIIKLVNESQNGFVTSKEITDAGIHRGYIQQLVNEGYLLCCNRGIYIKNEVLEDELFLLNSIYKKGVFSNETALYIHGYTDRTPLKYEMTFEQGYNAKSIKDRNLIVKHLSKELYEMGIIKKNTLSGNEIYVYDLERTLCDILRGKNLYVEIINPAMKKYASSKDKDLNKLFYYAKKLKVYSKVLRYMEVLL